MGLKRRTFLQFLAGGAVGTVATPVVWQGIDDAAIWTQNFPWIPRIPKGKVEYTPVVSKFCSSLSGSKIGMVGGNPVCVSANSDNPFSMGGVSSLAGTEVQMLYSPSRIKEPMVKTATGYTPISWEDALVLAQSKITEAGNSCAVLSGDDTSSVNEILSSILSHQGSGNFFFMPNERQVAQTAWEMLGGKDLLVYQYQKSNLIIAIGANVVDNFGLPIRFVKLREQSKAKLIYVGSYANNTYAVADSKYMIVPGSEVTFMLRVIYSLLERGYTLPQVEGAEYIRRIMLHSSFDKDALIEIGISEERFNELINQLMAARAPLFIAGSPVGSGTPVALAMLSLFVTQMLAEGHTPLATVSYLPSVLEKAISFKNILKNDALSYLLSLSQEAPLKCMITYQANPLYALPDTKKVEAQWNSSISYKIAIASFMDETTATSDLILPLTLSIEGVDDGFTPYGADKGFYYQTTPCIAPVCNAQSGASIALALASSLGVPLSVESADEFFAKKLALVKAKQYQEQAGVYSIEPLSAPPCSRCNPMPLQVYFAAVPIKPHFVNGQRDDIYLLPYGQLYMGSATTSVPPFNVKNIPSSCFKNKEMYVMMNKITAGKHFKAGDTVEITNGEDSIRAKVYMHEGVMDNTIAILAGLGHTAFDSFTRGKGVNPMRVVQVENRKEPLLCSWSRNTVKVTKV